MLSAPFYQGEVNHVIGDNYYEAILLNGKKTIVTFHGGLVPLGSIGKLSAFFFKFFWLKLPARSARIVTCVSDFLKQEIVHITNVPPDKIRVVHNPLNPLFQYTPKSFNNAKPRILHVGTFPLKNLPRLICAIEGIPCHLRIVGNLEDEHLALLQEKQVDYSSTSNLSPEQMIEEYKNCDILSMVSLYESFGLPIIEAQAVGRAVITSDTAAMPEVAGKGACFVDPTDVESIRAGILQIIEDELFRDKLIEKGLENVRRFEAKKIASAYAKLYEFCII